MLDWLRSSLPARAGLAVILIAILALASSLSAGTPLPQLAGVGAVSSLSNESQPLQETSTAGPRSHA